MTVTVATTQTAVSGPAVSPIVLMLILLVLFVGLVLIVRILLVRLHNSVSQSVRGGVRDPVAEDSLQPGGESATTEAGPDLGQTRRQTGRELKRRYLSGKISKPEYDEQLRRIQIEEFLEGDK